MTLENGKYLEERSEVQKDRVLQEEELIRLGAGKDFPGRGDILRSEWQEASLSLLGRVKKIKWRGHNSGLSLGYQGQASSVAEGRGMGNKFYSRCDGRLLC